MNQHCFDEGTIQAFMDGELASEMQEQVACHVAICDACAVILAEAEEESAAMFAALDQEFNPLVPSERIRTAVYSAIAVERQKASFWSRLFGGLGLARFSSFMSPSLTAFAGMALAAGMIAIVLSSRVSQSPDTAAKPQINTPQAVPQEAVTQLPVPAQREGSRDIDAPNKAESDRAADGMKYSTTRYRKEKPVVAETPQKRAQVEQSPRQTVVIDPQEDNYIKTIATLQQNVDYRKDDVLRPSQRVAYERDMAAVEGTISRMRKELRRNPKNTAARQMLNTSYQYKIDLMNSVAEQGELMASAR